MTKLSKKTATTAITALLMATANIASADELLSPVHYGEELDRCVAEIRGELGSPNDTRMRHTVSDISKSGAWYRFYVTTEVLATDDSVAQTAASECRANRFDETTKIRTEKS